MSSILRQPSHHRRALILLTPLRTSPSSSSPTLLSTRPYAQTPSDPSDSSTQTTVVPADEPTASPDSDPRGPPDMSILQRATPTHTPLTTYLDPTGALDVTKVNIPLNIDHKPEPRPDTRAGTYAVRDDHPLYAFFHKDPLTGKYDAMRRYTEDEVNLAREWTQPELRQRSFQELHTLWFLNLREKNIYYTQRAAFEREKLEVVGPEARFKQLTKTNRMMRKKIQTTMRNIKTVLTERARSYQTLQGIPLPWEQPPRIPQLPSLSFPSDPYEGQQEDEVTAREEAEEAEAALMEGLNEEELGMLKRELREVEEAEEREGVLKREEEEAEKRKQEERLKEAGIKA